MLMTKAGAQDDRARPRARSEAIARPFEVEGAGWGSPARSVSRATRTTVDTQG